MKNKEQELDEKKEQIERKEKQLVETENKEKQPNRKRSIEEVGSGKTTDELQRQVADLRRVIEIFELRESHKRNEQKAKAEAAEEQIEEMEREKIRQEMIQASKALSPTYSSF